MILGIILVDASRIMAIFIGSIIIIIFSFYSFGGYLSSNATKDGHARQSSKQFN